MDLWLECLYGFVFYINYEECKFIHTSMTDVLLSRFILTMRNVNCPKLDIQIEEGTVLY